MKPLHYPADFTAEPEGGFTITFPDLAEAISYGEDDDDAMLMAMDCLETVIGFKIQAGESIPAPSRAAKGQRQVPVPPVAAAKLLLYWEMKRQNLRKAQLARRLNWHTPQVDRLLDVGHESKISQIQTALAALGKTLTVGIDELR